MNFQPSKIVFISFFVLALTGCQDETLTLLAKDNKVLGQGTIDLNGLAHIQMGAKEYIGHWNASNIYSEELAKQHRLAGTRSYEAYLLGNTPDQMKHGHALLTAQDGSELICDVFYQRQPRLGNCIMDGESLELAIKQDAKTPAPEAAQ